MTRCPHATSYVIILIIFLHSLLKAFNAAEIVNYQTNQTHDTF